MDNSRILVISDMQAPFHHKDAIDFLTELKKKVKPTRVISIGDLYDFNYFSDYGKNPNLYSGSRELELVNDFTGELGKVFPEMEILDSNHGNRIRRQAFKAGLPYSVLRDEMEIIGAPKKWKLVPEIIAKLPNGSLVKLIHNFGANSLGNSKDQAMSVVQGHFHSKMDIQYWSNGRSLHFGATIGCLIDDSKKEAFGYNVTQSKRPCLGAFSIEESRPNIYPMILNRRNNWIGIL